jgi:hypothetical protein
MLVRNFAMTAGHHNEGDGSEQTRETADNYDDKHDSPSNRMFGSCCTNRELGVLPVPQRTGYKSCRSIGGHTPSARGRVHRDDDGTPGEN